MPWYTEDSSMTFLIVGLSDLERQFHTGTKKSSFGFRES